MKAGGTLGAGKPALNAFLPAGRRGRILFDAEPFAANLLATRIKELITG